LEFFAKAGADEGWMVARTSGWITWHSPNTPLFKGGASAAGTACAGADSPWAADGLSYANSLKWIAAGIQPEESQSIPVRMELQTDQQGTEKKFVLELASFEKTGEKYSRNPFDAGLGVAKDAEEKGWCQAQAAQFNFSIKEPNMACDGNACLEVVYRQGSAYLCGPGTDRLDCSGAYAESGPKAGALAAEWKLNVLAKPTGAQKIEFTGAGVKNHSWVNYYDMEELACKALPCASIDVSKLSFPYLNPFEPEASGSFEIDAATIAAGTTSLALSFKHAAGTVTKTTRLGFARLGVEWFKHGTTTPCDPLKEGEAKDCSVMSVNGGKQLIEVFFKQEAAEGGNLFAAQAKRTMAINYSVADEDGGTADFSLSWASPCLEKEYEPASKKFSGKTAEGKASGELAATPSCGTAPDSPVEITLSYKDLIYSTELAIQETVVPPAAPSVYELRYAPSDAAEPMKVFCLNPADKATCACRTPAEALPGAECAVDAIDFTVSGVFPADAVFLLLNWSASPKRDVPPFWKELDDAKCFAIENEENKFPDITGYSASTGMQTVLLKFNAFNPGCTLYKETKGFTTAQIQPRALKPFSYSVIAGAGAPIAFKELPVSLSWDRNAPDVIVVPASDYLAEKDMLKFNMVEDTPDFTKRLWLLIYNAQGTENAPAKTLAVSTTDGAYRISLPATAPQITVFATASRSADFVVSEKIGDDWLTPETALATQGSLYGIESLGQAASLNQLPAMSSALLFHRGNIKVGDVQRGFPFAAFSKDDAVLEMPTDSFTRAAKWEQCDYAKYGGQGVYQITYTARKRDETGNDAFDQSAVGKLKYLGKNALFDTSGLAQTYLDSGDELCGYGYVECGPALLVLSQKPFEQLENVFDDGAIVADEYGSVDQPVPQPYRFHMHKDTCILVKYVGWGRKVIRAAEDRVMYWQVYSFYEPLSDVQELFAMCPKGGEGDKCTSSGYVSGLKWTGEWTGTEEGTAKKEMDSKVLSDKKLVLSLKNDGYDSNDCAENYRILDECIYTNDNNAQCDITKECGYKDSGSNKPCKLQGCVGEYDSGTGTCSSGGKNDVEELWGTYSGGCGPGDGDCSPYCASTGQNKY
ncbi:MAG: hypothetical protein NTY90_04085, partial [Candidatus Micrarchaeota archaeon]|nr:hypothetical protein [Candidatus Micrarchaeota archaeon]